MDYLKELLDLSVKITITRGYAIPYTIEWEFSGGLHTSIGRTLRAAAKQALADYHFRLAQEQQYLAEQAAERRQAWLDDDGDPRHLPFEAPGWNGNLAEY